MIPPHLFYQIYLSFLEQNDCTPPRCGELSDYTQVEDPSLGCMNGSNVYDRCGHDTRLLDASDVCACVRDKTNLPIDPLEDVVSLRPHIIGTPTPSNLIVLIRHLRR